MNTRKGRERVDGLILREMLPEDMDGKGYVHWRCWQDCYAGLVDAGYLERLTLARCRAMARQWPENILVAVTGGGVSGFTAQGPCGDGDLHGAGELFALYVLPEYHGTRLGYLLMEAAMERLAAFPRVALWVLRGNARAIVSVDKGRQALCGPMAAHAALPALGGRQPACGPSPCLRRPMRRTGSCGVFSELDLRLARKTTTMGCRPSRRMTKPDAERAAENPVCLCQPILRFYERYGFRFDGAARELMLGAPATAWRMVWERPQEVT